jgi:prepilin-type N-terminal cleavage/methylation domain-containing protein
MTTRVRPTLLRRLQLRREDATKRGESGFTLIELLVTMVILPLIVGALALSIVGVLQLNGSTNNRINDAADAQILSTSYENDVHSATQVTTQTTPQCGSGTEVLGLEWGANQSGGFQTVVSYVLTPTASASSDNLVREYCSSGPSVTPTSSSVVAQDMSPWTPPSTVSNPDPALPSLTTNFASNGACVGDSQASFATGWVDASCVAGINFSANEPLSSFKYTLVAVPLASASSGRTVTPTASSNCGFATAGSGTYASSLCFVDFSKLDPAWYSSTSSTNPSYAQCPSGGQYLSAVIDYTPFVMSFCLLISPGTTYSTISSQVSAVCASPSTYGETKYGTVCPAWMPTYYNPPYSEAYLGNNGFYTGVDADLLQQGRPAIYETVNGSIVNLHFYNIKVADANGKPATGWELATGDAESTDHDEDIVYSTCAALPAVSGTYGFQSCTGIPFQLLPDSPGSTQSDDIGNACSDVGVTVPGTMFPGTWLTGAGTYNTTTQQISGGTNTVECAGGDSGADNTDKTGTVMLEAAQPSTLNIQLNGYGNGLANGLQAIFVGLVLQ